MSTETPEQVTHLWEVEHPYYCHGCYGTETFDSWSAMKADADGMDGEYNMLIRWDWHLVDDINTAETLELTFVQQRKGLTMTWSCPISAAEEDDVRSWLFARSIDLRRVWAPLDLSTPQSEQSEEVPASSIAAGPVELPAELARELACRGPNSDAIDGWTVVANEEFDHSRWDSIHRLVIRNEAGEHFMDTYRQGLTERQDYGPYEYEDTATFTPVEPTFKVVTEWKTAQTDGAA